MIVPMKRVFAVTAAGNRDAFLEALRDLGVVHLEPVDPAAGPSEDVAQALSRVRRARQAVAMVRPAGPRPEVSAPAAVEEILAIVRRGEEARQRLVSLAREADALAVWGDLRLERLERLAKANVPVEFHAVPEDLAADVSGELVVTLRDLPGKRVLVAVVQREGKATVPEGSRHLSTPGRDIHAVRREAADLDDALATGAKRLSELAHLADPLEQEQRRLTAQAEYEKALAGAKAGGDLFAVQGWAPADEVATLGSRLAAVGRGAAVTWRDPLPEEQPPTLIRYPRWARPIKGLFDILGTSPGYREFDVSSFFMIALPVFAAMLIGDAGYGLVFLLGPLAVYRRAVARAGPEKVHLMVVVGAVALVWGLLTGCLFGASPEDFRRAGGVLTHLAGVLQPLRLISGDVQQQTRTIMKISFLLGTIHLSAGQLRQALGLFPHPRALAHAGWAAFLWGLLGVIWFLFFGSQKTPPEAVHPATGWLLGGGAALAILFAHPSRNALKMIGLGLAGFPLTAVGKFSDTISYVRLMAVGMASTVIGQTFNGLAVAAAGGATWLLGVPILLLGHGLNIALCLIALLAHGVRLNMLEFSGNAGVQWGGYPYQPFAGTQVKET